MDKHNRIDLICEVLNELSHAQFVATVCIERLKELVDPERPWDARRAGAPHVEPASFSVVWKRRRCPLGYTTSFRLMERLLRRADQYVSYDQLREDVWLGENRSGDTVRSAVRQLKKKLRDAGMPELASAIRGQGHHYGLMLARR